MDSSSCVIITIDNVAQLCACAKGGSGGLKIWLSDTAKEDVQLPVAPKTMIKGSSVPLSIQECPGFHCGVRLITVAAY